MKRRKREICLLYRADSRLTLYKRAHSSRTKFHWQARCSMGNGAHANECQLAEPHCCFVSGRIIRERWRRAGRPKTIRVPYRPVGVGPAIHLTLSPELLKREHDRANLREPRSCQRGRHCCPSAGRSIVEAQPAGADRQSQLINRQQVVMGETNRRSRARARSLDIALFVCGLWFVVQVCLRRMR